jgi:filamentous hemagglutinin
MIVAAMKGGATEFKIGSQVAGKLANIEQLSGKLNDLNAGKLPGEAELSKYYDKTPLGQAISEANKTGLGGAKGIPSINRSTEITELFSSTNIRSGIQIGNRSLIEVPNTGNAKIFSGATESEVKQYFSELTKSSSLPSPRNISGKGDIYVVSTPEGNFTLRNFSSSSGQTGPAWTIDVPRAAAGTTYNPEIKFLIGTP